MTFNPAHSQNFVDLLVRRAERHPERIALHCIADGDGAVLSYGFADLDRRARAVAAHLQTVCAPGDRALILLHSGIDYVAAFFGCLYAGVIAVPAYPPESQAPQHLKRVASILHDAQPKLVLSHTALLDSVNAALATRCVSQRPAAIAVDQIDNAEAAAWRMPVIARDALAFLQYTSGSTASPKGVMVGHDNLLANQRAIKHGFGIHEDDVFVSWLPLYHDMGLVGSLMQPLYSGIPLALMSPRHFLERPLRWLEAVSRFGGTISGGPDFAYRLCNERIGEAQLVGLRLDSWRLAFCGAEPIRHETLASFAEKFSIAGLPASAPYPCYGLAEASLLVSGGLPGEGAHAVVYAADALAEHRAELAESGSVIVDCGRVQPEHQLAIVDLASGLECDECRIGEIRFSGPSVTHGYWQNPAATLEAFVHEDGKTWLRTGDLGFVRDGRLFVAGRVKDMILIRGQNLYPQDIEQALEEQIKLLRKGRVAAFSVNVDGREGIGIAAEIGRGTQKRVPAENLFDAINDTLAQCCQQPATLILLLNPGALPKTSSGKLQRRACYQAWREGALDVYASQWDGQRQPEQAAAEELTDFERSVAMIWREVLNVTTVSAQQSFFALGGQSIAVIQAVAALSEQLGVTVEPALFFEKPKLREFAAVVEAQVNESATATVAPIAKGEQSEGLLLTYGQESLWFLMQLDPSSTAYQIAGGARIVGELDREVLTQAFGVLAQRHDALRTVFYAVDGQPRQRILPAFDVDLAYHDVRELPCDEAQAQAAQLAEQSARIPFDLERGPLWRMLLVRLPAQDGQACHELNLTLHHLIADGWSLNRLLAEFAECYGAIQAGREPRLPLLPIRHADFASWQRHWLEAGEAERQLAYWTEWLGGEQPVIELPYDRARPAEPSQRGGRVNFVLPEAVSQALPAVARQHGVTPFMLLLAAFNVLLYRYSGQNDLRIGLPLANRNRPETQHLIGYFVNTVVLRSQINAQSGFDTLLQHTKQTLLQAQAHPDLPFEHLVDALQPERRLGQNPLFQILINHQQTDIGLLAQHADWQIEALDRDNGAAQFDLSLDTWQDSRGRIGGFFTYASDLFDGATIERLAGHYQNLLAQLLAQPQAAIAAHGLLGGEEARQLQAWNTWPKTYDQQTPVHELIRRQAQAQPDALALIAGEASLSYAELDAQANRLAHRLLAEGLGRESRVALLLPRGIEAIAAMLAVLKAGAAYLPLDPEQPAQRLAELIADAGVSLILHQDYLHAQPTWLNLAGLDLSTQPATLPEVKIHPEQLAYLILTSGSTGKPKCVAVAHGALTRHCLAIGERYAMQQDDVALHFAAFTFDAAMEQWLVPMINGCRLLVREALWSADQAYDALLRYGVTWFEMPPAYLLEIARWAEPRGLRLPLRACSVGGEAVPKESLAMIRRLVGDAPILNGYGPTETLITPLAWTALPDSVCDTAYAPIGTGVGERALYVLDKDLNQLPLGSVGELYLGGPCLARGYLGRPDLSAERFLPDPFAADGTRMYRTGDLVRFRNDGNVDYFGRNDHQIKLRGFRIELGEIEAQALSHPGVAEAVVVADGGGHAKRLLLYAVGATDAKSLKSHLCQRLPDYMVPAHVQIIDQLPRLSSGKLNRHALPRPEAQAGDAHRVPQTSVERDLAAIWQAVLGVERVGADDNFFELGGDSIMAIRLVSRARQAGWSLTPKDLFLHQTVAKLAANVQAIPTQVPREPAAKVVGEAPLTPIQAQFFAQAMPNRNHWNLSLLLQPKTELDAARLAKAVGRLLEHHDGLRLRYRWQQGVWRQFYAEADTAAVFEHLHVEGAAAIAKLAEHAQRSLSLQHGPLFKVVLLGVADGGQRLLLVAHHLLVDGVSWRIVLEDLQALYDEIEVLPDKTASLRQWGECLRNYAASESLKRQLPYWQGVLQNAAEPPRDFASSNGCFGDARTLTLEIDAERTRRLLTQAPAAYRTQINDLLLAALARVMCAWCGGEVVVDLESHGREPVFDGFDLSRSVGWFTGVYPVKLADATDISATIKAVKQSLRDVPDAGLGFGVLQYLAGDGERAALSALPQAKIGFNYFGRIDAEAGNFALASETAGDDHDPAAPLPYWLEINAQVVGGRLQLRWRYSAIQYRDETVQALLARYREELLGIVEHCLSGASGATPSDFPLASLTQAQLDALPLAFAEIEDIYPLSPMQQGMLFHDLLAPETGVYVNQMSLDIDGLDSDRFAAAWRRAIARHALLRTAFLWRGESEQPLQIVYKQAPLSLEILDWRGGREIGEADLQGLRNQDRARGFDHARAPLLRMILVRLSERRWHWIWTSHHSLLDGWSTSQLLGEVLDDYVGNQRHAGSATYRDYIAWLSRRDAAAAETFWHARLSLLDEPTLLADALAKPMSGQGHGSQVCRLDAAATARLQTFAQQQRVTLNTLLQAAWALLLGRYCGRDTVALGATVSGRPADLRGVECIVGLFINTLPLIARIKAGQRVGDWLRELQQENLAMRDYEHTPLYDVQRWAGQAGTALFDSLLVFENFPVDAALANSASGLSFGLPQHVDTTHYPLTLNVSIGETLGLAYGYWLDRFDAETVARIARHLEQLLFALAENAECRLGEIVLPAAEELGHQATQNTAETAYPPGLAHELISQTATVQPDAPALLFGDAAMSYAELESRANRLAHYLIDLGVGPEMPVGIAVERSFELVVGLLAIVKAGGAYVPLDPDYPDERLAYMIEDSGIGLLLSHGAVIDKFRAICSTPEKECVAYDLDNLDVSGFPGSAPLVNLHPSHPAYIIYTSGSTGRPKGATNTHAALANRLRWMQQAYAIGPNDTVLQKTPFSFDVSVWEFFWPLMTGARLAIAAPGAHRDPAALADTLRRQQVTTLHFVPSMLAEFVNQPNLPNFPALKRIVCSGEALSADLQQRVFERLPGVELNNLYGPTEAAIDVTHWTCRADGQASVPIGEAIANIQIHILDRDLNPQPAGVAGELYIGGIGLARGYHRRPGLSAERFLPDPFGSGGRLYRTGDLARRRADGVIDYLGRIDQQIKLRGLRIELGEIEAALLGQPGIQEAAVILKGAAGGPRLVAYLAANPEAADDTALQNALRRQLPDYMLPSALIRLDSLPKTANGKLDRKALPEPSWQGQTFRAPQSATEQTLAAIWQDLLGVEQVGLDDNFFQLGGHSLLAMKLAGRISQHFQIELGVRRVFEVGSLSVLAAEIDALLPASPTLDLQGELADALAELQGMSTEDLRALLAE